MGLDWDKVARLKDVWGGKVILKGILDQDDAKMALKVGADAIIVSNHGGRQLDGALSSIKALPGIVERWAIRLKCIWMVASALAKMF